MLTERSRFIFLSALMISSWIVANVAASPRGEFISDDMATESKENGAGAVETESDEQMDENSAEYLWQFQELLRCTMGIDGIMELLEKYNCTDCQRCFKQWNTGYLQLNQRPICEEFEGQLYTLSYDYECFGKAAPARCLKTYNRCQYETCKLDTKFVACLQSLQPSKFLR